MLIASLVKSGLLARTLACSVTIWRWPLLLAAAAAALVGVLVRWLPVWAELAQRLSRDGAFPVSGLVHEGELSPGASVDLIATTTDTETLFDHLFRQLAEIVRSAPEARRPVVLAEVREYFAEVIRLLDPSARWRNLSDRARARWALYPARPNPAKPMSIMAQVEGSGTAALRGGSIRA